jgi:hypothetical protein
MMQLKKTFYLFFLSLLGFSFPGKTQSSFESNWIRHFGNNGYDHLSVTELDDENSMYLAGFFYDSLEQLSAKGASDIYLRKVDSLGNTVWLLGMGGNADDRVLDMFFDTYQQRILLTGYFSDSILFQGQTLYAHAFEDVFLISLDKEGNLQWLRSFEGNGSEAANTISSNQRGDIVIGGYYDEQIILGTDTLDDTGLRSTFLSLLDSAGQVIKSFSILGNSVDEPKSVIYDIHGSIYCTGYFRDTIQMADSTLCASGLHDVFLGCFDQNLNLKWVNKIHSIHQDRSSDIEWMPMAQKIVLSGDFMGVLQIGDTSLVSNIDEQVYIAIFDTTGQLDFAFQFGSLYAETSHDICVDHLDRIYCVGTFDSVIVFGQDTFIAKHYNAPTDFYCFQFDKEGNLLRGLSGGGLLNDFGFYVNVTDSGKLYLSGLFNQHLYLFTDSLSSFGNYDVFLVELNPDYFLSTESFQKDTYLKVFPNPSHYSIQVEMPSLDLPFSYQIYTWEGKLYKNSISCQNMILVNDLPMGKYILLIQNQNFTYKSKLIIHE